MSVIDGAPLSRA